MLIKVKVKTKSGRSKLEKIDNENYRAFLLSAPENNRANLELIKLLSKEFKIAKSLISLDSGLKSREKVFKIEI